MSSNKAQTGESGFSRNRFVFWLGFDAANLALLGSLLCVLLMESSLWLGPDQLAEMMIRGFLVLPPVLGIDLGLGLVFFIPVYQGLGPLAEGRRMSEAEALAIWKRLLGFPFQGMVLSMGIWAASIAAMAWWLVHDRVATADQAWLVAPAGALLGMSTSIGYYFRSRSLCRPVLARIFRDLPPTFAPPRSSSFGRRLSPALIFIAAALTLSIAAAALSWRQQLNRRTALAVARERLFSVAAAIKAGSPPVMEEAELAAARVRPFVIKPSGEVTAGRLRPSEKVFIFSNPRLLGRAAWEAEGPFRASLTREFTRFLPLPEEAGMKSSRGGPGSAGSLESWIILQRSPLLGGQHPGVVVELTSAATRESGSWGQPLLLMTFAALSILAIAVWSVWLIREVLEPVRELTAGVVRLGEDPLSARAAVLGDDEIGHLTSAFNRMSRSLGLEMQNRRQVLSGIQAATNTLSIQLGRMGTTITDQAAGAAEQAVSLHQISTTSEEIAATLRTIAENAQAVEEVAGRSLSSCHTGQTQLQETLSAMDLARSRTKTVADKMISFQEQANRIQGILDFIREVSERINLIALNAAIEASAAGESADRFFVIAGEMRKLAELTMNGTKEIQGLFADLEAATSSAIIATEEGEKLVDAARKRADQTSESFQLIIHWASETARSAHEISLSSTQQTTATDHLAAALAETREVAARFAEGAKTMESSAADFGRIGEELLKLHGEK